jgi:protein involved in polysaccharide export with SLBB domain
VRFSASRLIKPWELRRVGIIGINRIDGIHKPLPLPLAALGVFAVASLVLAGCSSSRNSHTESAGANGANQVGTLSPEQCESGAAIQSAALKSSPDQNTYRIQQGDDLAINFYLSPEFDDETTVSPDGNIHMRLVGSLAAAGMTPAELAQEIDKAYAGELRTPDAVVQVKTMPSRQVYVEGQVTHPGAFPLEPGMTALQAVADAGGVTQDAGDKGAVLIRRDACGRPAGQELDLASAAKHPEGGDDVMLMPYDVLVIPRSKIANMDLFVQQYIRGLLPIQPSPTIPIF